MLIALGGLPATGKTTLARLLAARTGAVHLRIDTIEQALVRAGVAARPVGPAGYVVGYALAEEQLRLGLTVIADSVNPLAVTRDAWRDTAVRAGVPVVEAEVLCSDRAEHRRRVRTRTGDVTGMPLPGWPEVTGREYEPWDRDHVVVDTAGRTPEEALASLLAAMAPGPAPQARRR
ncbi:AAA family ATPase [Streptomyces argyrophyllae]|uniref:AAA family ATPase n=1 Tax=Streptomyces argyrophylli TaxID=2726118 RepID=A0A6M4PCD1_9ACTN|nr:AAA family ATPase [Streptomyces argyrophyllae]QJS08788.1 AAA family ATPase [Streptomyces argyrophyllae]